ncbi:MAG: aspartyl protease family protein [Nevskiales bacterium]|nr:aspartyl protease family protein [Nevskiales bacterium]
MQKLLLWSGLILLLSVASAQERERAVVSSSAMARLQTTLKQGLFLTRARIGDQEFGPFLLDTGASRLVLDAGVAQQLKLPVVGESEDRNTGRKLKLGLLNAIEVGPVMLENTPVAVLDLSPMARSFGETPAGILGTPFFAGAIVEFDYENRTVACFDPRNYRLAQGRWQALSFSGNRPAVLARLEGNVEGLFILDTGAGITVSLFPDFAREHGLTDRGVIKTRTVRVEGEVEELEGRLEWFELAGHRFERPIVFFRTPKNPDARFPEGVAGLIGQDFLREFKVVFNYPESQIAFLHR